MINCFDITDFGALSDGRTDCTKAIQAALDKAGEVEGKVIVPPGEYLCGYLRLPRNVTVKGTYAWEFGRNGGSVLKLNDNKVPCLMDITAAFGCCIDGICLDGGDIGEDIHGVMVKWENRLESRKKFGGKEDTPTIANCRISNFSGNAVHYENIWCFSIHNSMLCFSKNGLFAKGCDAFITDNWFSCNREDGIHSPRFVSGTFTGNRIECNYGNGIYLYDCGTLQFSNNYFDANEKNAFYAADEGEDFRGNINLNGNIFYRTGYDFSGSGKADVGYSHINISHATNIVINGNTFAASESGAICPDYGITIKQLRSSVIKNNSFMYASGKQNLVDLGGHKEDVIISDNAGLDFLSTKEKKWPRFED